MKKRVWAIVLVVLLAAGAGIFAGIRYFQNTYVIVDDAVYAGDVTYLDLSGSRAPDVEKLSGLTQLKKLDLRDTGVSAEEYETLRAALPGCEILWQVPFQGEYLETDVKELTISSLNQGELESLSYLPELESIDAEGCADLDMLMELQSRYPDVEVSYRVPVGGRNVACGTTILMVNDPDIDELSKNLPYLPKLEKLMLNGEISDRDGVLELVEAYPEMEIQWNVDIQGRAYVNTTREIDLSGLQLESVAPVEEALKYFPNLEKVIMCNCGLSSEELDALWKRNPDVRIVWSVKVRFFEVRTDVTTFMPYQYGCAHLSNDDVESLKYLVDLVCIDIGHLGLTDLSFLEYTPNVEYLIIADAGVRDISPLAHLKKLKYLEMFLNHVTDISALAECTQLRDLNMCYNYVKDITPLLELEHLEHIWIKGNGLSWESAQLLEETFPDAKIMVYSQNRSSTGDGWRKIPGYYEQRDLLGMWYTLEN